MCISEAYLRHKVKRQCALMRVNYYNPFMHPQTTVRNACVDTKKRVVTNNGPVYAPNSRSCY